ncbi:hypothetical protein V6N13_008133 [Hibiscus sabdariffa]
MFDDLSSGRHSTYIPNKANPIDFSSIVIYSSVTDVNLDIGRRTSQWSRDRVPTAEPNRVHVSDESELYRLEAANSDEEPLMEPGPKGEEMGLFPEEPPDLDEPVNAEDGAFDVAEEELVEVVGTDNFTATRNSVAYNDPPSYFTNNGYGRILQY